MADSADPVDPRAVDAALRRLLLAQVAYLMTEHDRLVVLEPAARHAYRALRLFAPGCPATARLGAALGEGE